FNEQPEDKDDRKREAHRTDPARAVPPEPAAHATRFAAGQDRRRTEDGRDDEDHTGQDTESTAPEPFGSVRLPGSRALEENASLDLRRDAYRHPRAGPPLDGSFLLKRHSLPPSGLLMPTSVAGRGTARTDPQTFRTRECTKRCR